ncbi:DUF5107 domain-containing protein [Microbacterium panaciterrae]|uniref:DUF5107 domain-containing protein n=1 Tax=Microbacterium panaciterrae TaxID=985759 RepID=A0ABP8PT31_9MICO
MDERFTLPAAPTDLAEHLAAGGAIAWAENVTIPTYEPGEPEALPIFSEARVYQGSSGRVYPIPFVESIAYEKHAREWRAIHLENRWIRLMVLPELGGRIHVGYDKIADYDFFYRNNVIKPALVGLAGPWISGGVEFNWPQHHRPATHLPVDAEIEVEADGAVTVWCTDHDPFARMRASHGIRLRPDSTVIELRARLHNRTEDRQTFLWWANVAAGVHERYQSFFPPDVHYVADHARRAVTAFPRADRPYYGVDYPARVSEDHPDADRLDFYTNITVPTSYMVLSTRDDFFGGYDHARRAGFVHWADRRIAPGKKQWTWGNHAFGHAWDRQLTDGDGPYVELMAGVFTDNQPDFSFLAPGEVREFSQYWYPISKIGVPLHATTSAALAVHATKSGLQIGVASTTSRDIVLRVTASGEVLHEGDAKVSPEDSLILDVATDRGVDEVEVDVVDGAEVLARWSTPRDRAAWKEPEVATEPPAPQDISSSDELFLTGLHLSQYRHPTRGPEPYWTEAVLRDPGDSRSLVALAASEYRRGRYGDAAALCRRAIERLIRRNPNPSDPEAYYRLGLALLRLGDEEAAHDAFGRAEWAAAWAPAARLEQARIDARAGRDSAALARLTEPSTDPRVAATRVVLLRRLGGTDAAGEELQRARCADAQDRWLRILDGKTTGEDARTLIDVALEFRAVGDTTSALSLLDEATTAPTSDGGSHAAMAYYLSAEILDHVGREADAAAARRRGSDANIERAFPSGLADLDALLAAIDANPKDTTARDLAGTWMYDVGRRDEALSLWQAAYDAGGRRPVLLRNLALAKTTVASEERAAAELYDQAIAEDSMRARLLLERDLLGRRLGETAAERLARLDHYPESTATRDDLIVLRASLLTDVNQPAEAIDLLQSRQLRAWEGGEGVVLAAWDRACFALAHLALSAGSRIEALSWVDRLNEVPETLGEQRHELASLAEARFLRGQIMGDASEWEKGTNDSADPVRHPTRLADEATYWVGRCALAIGDTERADLCWSLLEDRAQQLRTGQDTIDYFATSVPELSVFGLDPGAAPARANLLESLAREGRTHALPRKEFL